MPEPIQDFNTFFVAVSPQLGKIDQLKKNGDSIEMKLPVTANFANGTSILKGEDCLAISAKLLTRAKGNAVLYTSFLAPKAACINYINIDLSVPVVHDTLNKFQMVIPAGNDLYNVNYGRECFYVTNTILKKSDGKNFKRANV